MSRMAADTTKGRRSRRRFDDEFNAQAVRLVLDGKSVAAVAGDLDLTPSVLGRWVAHARADRTKGRTGLTTAERDENAWIGCCRSASGTYVGWFVSTSRIIKPSATTRESATP